MGGYVLEIRYIVTKALSGHNSSSLDLPLVIVINCADISNTFGILTMPLLYHITILVFACLLSWMLLTIAINHRIIL